MAEIKRSSDRTSAIIYMKESRAERSILVGALKGLSVSQPSLSAHAIGQAYTLRASDMGRSRGKIENGKLARCLIHLGCKEFSSSNPAPALTALRSNTIISRRHVQVMTTLLSIEGRQV